MVAIAPAFASLLLLALLVACGGGDGDGAAPTGGAETGAGVSGSAGAGGNSVGAGAVPNKVAIAIQLTGATCIAQTTWALPDSNLPVTATDRGMLAVDEGRDSGLSARCMVNEVDGIYDIEGGISLNRGETSLGVNARVDPATPTPGGFQLRGPMIRQDISSNQAGPCLFTVFEASEGNAWGKVECASTHERDMTECGAATLYFAFEDCFTDRGSFYAEP